LFRRPHHGLGPRPIPNSHFHLVLRHALRLVDTSPGPLLPISARCPNHGCGQPLNSLDHILSCPGPNHHLKRRHDETRDVIVNLIRGGGGRYNVSTETSLDEDANRPGEGASRPPNCISDIRIRWSPSNGPHFLATAGLVPQRYDVIHFDLAFVAPTIAQIPNTDTTPTTPP